jgi:amino acid adenylation domain-containing protein
VSGATPPPALAGLSREEKLALLARLARERSRPPGTDAAAAAAAAATAAEAPGSPAAAGAAMAGSGPGAGELPGSPDAAAPAMAGSGPGAGDLPRWYPLAFAQQRFWFLQQLDPESYVDHVFRALRLGGPLDRAALAGALAELGRRHAALRTRFPVVDGEPRQLVEPELPGGAPGAALVDLSHLPAARIEAAAGALAGGESRRPFDLARGPLYRARLLRLGSRDHALLLAVHHVVCDGWSLGLLLRELAVLYGAFAAGQPSPLPEPRASFGELAAGQRERLQGEALARELVFWRKRLAGAPPVLELPADHPRRQLASPRGEVVAFEVEAGAAAAFLGLAREAGVTPFMALLALFDVLLFRYTGQGDLVVGAPAANRHRTELESVVGCFASTVLVRAEVERGMNFRALLAQARAEVLAVSAHSELPFEKLVEELQPERNLSHNPLFQVMFALQQAAAGGLAMPGLTVGPLPVARGLAKLDLTLEMAASPSGLGGYFEYSTDLFEQQTIARLARHLQALLAAAAAEPARAVGDLPMLLPDERRQVLEEWNQRAAGMPALVPAAVAEQARRTPGAPAVLFEGETLTFEELDVRANRLARRLRRLGVGPEVTVGVCVERSLEMPLVLLAVLKSGGAWVPLDPEYPRERLALMIADAGVSVLLVQERLAERLPGAGAGGGRAVLNVDRLDLSAEDPADPDWPIHPESLAYVVYTSGSTGRPKGVAVPHRAMANHVAICAERYRLGPADRVLQFTSISFDITSEEIFPAWLAGAAVVPRPPGLFPSFGELAELIARHRITVVDLPTAYWHEWVGEMHRAKTAPPEPLRLVVIGTEQALPERVAEWLQLAGERVRLNNSYASTEATVTAVVYEPSTLDLARFRAGDRVPVGKTLRNCRAYVLDAGLEPVPVGVPGDVYIGGPNVSRGYLNWPSLTAASFVPDPFADALGYGPGQRMYRQGDVGRWLPAGDLEYLGRRDDQVKIRGFRVEPAEVAAALARHPAVKDCVVLVRSDGAAGKRLVGYLTLVPGTAASARELRDFLRETLPEHMVPAALVPLPALPLTANGRVDQRALPDPAAEAVARADGGAAAGAGVDVGGAAGTAPRSAAEEIVAGVWCEVLGLGGLSQVGVEDDFFDLGGHSLLATQVISRLRERLGVELPLRALFLAPTVSALARRAEELRRGGTAAAPPAPPRIEPMPPSERGGPLELSFAQQRLWFLDRLEPGSAAYNIPLPLRLRVAAPQRLAPPAPLPAPAPPAAAVGPAAPAPPPLRQAAETRPAGLDVAALAAALGEVVRRHEVLRTTFVAGAGEPPRQVIHAPRPLRLPVVDLTGLAAERRQAVARDLVVAEGRRPFSLERGPLLRATLLLVERATAKGRRTAEDTVAAGGPSAAHRPSVAEDPRRPGGPSAAEGPSGPDGPSAIADHLLLCTLHHGVADGWSLPILVRELGLLYAAITGGRPAALPALPIQYADFARWQRRWLRGEALAAEVSHWRERLRGLPPLLELPVDRPRPPVRSWRGAWRGAALGRDLVAAVEGAGRRLGATPFMVVLAALAALLHRHGGQRSFAVGVPVAARNRVEIEPLIGCFVNTLVLRCDVDLLAPARQLVEQLRETVLDADAHQDLPFEKLVEELAPERSMSHSPLFQVALAFQNLPRQDFAAGGLELAPLAAGSGTAKFDLTFSVVADREQAMLWVEHAAELFDAATAGRLADHFIRLLAGIAAAPESRLGELPLLAAAERQQLLREWNPGLAPASRALAESATPPPPAPAGGRGRGILHRLFEAQVGRIPDRLAVCFGAENLTYRQLDERANRLARHLLAAGVGPGDLVGLCFERSLELVVAMLATLKAGAGYLPLDPSYPAERLAFAVEDSRAAVLLCLGAAAGRLPQRPGVRTIALDAEAAAIAARSPLAPAAAADPELPAYVIYTSGSTGRPKGVVIPHGNVTRLFSATADWFGFDERDTWTLFHSHAFDFSVWEIWGALLHGGRLVVVPAWESRSPEAFYGLLREQRVTVLNQTPAAFRQLLWAEEAALGGGAPPELDLRLVVFGGEALELASLAPWLRRHGDHRPLLVNMYGITETTVHVTYRPIRQRDFAAERGSVVGAPIPDLTLHVVDAALAPQPIGVPGEIAVGGEGVAWGYLGRPELTARRFVPDPHGPPGARLYRSGDLARRLPDGDLEYLGRIDRQVKIRGFRIEPGEIEAVLRRHPALSGAAVVARQDAPGEPRLVAYYVPVAGQAAVSAAELRAALGRELPDYMVPAWFVPLAALPLTANGKLDREALPAPGGGRPELGREYVAPAGPVEERLAAIWAEVLRRDRVGAQDNFFELGGHSLLATQVLSRMRLAFDVELPLRLLFDSPTVAGVAAAIVQRELERADDELLASLLDELAARPG